MSEITVETGELPVCVNCQFKHAVGLLHHVDPSMEKEKYDKTIELINEIGAGLMMTSQEVEDFIRVYQLEHKVEDVLTVARDLRHKIMEGSEERFEALEDEGNPGNPDGKRERIRATTSPPLKCGNYFDIRCIPKTWKGLFFSCQVKNIDKNVVCSDAEIDIKKGTIRFRERSSGDNPSNPIPETCEFTKEPVKPKGYFDKDSFRTICPECPDGRCANCPPELACATRIIIGCKEGEFVKGRCQVGTETHVIYHAEH